MHAEDDVPFLETIPWMERLGPNVWRFHGAPTYIEEMIQGEELKQILDRVLSPKLAPLNLRWNGGYRWIGENTNGVRNIFEYTLLKGMSGRLEWGVCFDFLKVSSGSKLVFNRTDKSARLHLFEYKEQDNSGKPMSEWYGTGDCLNTRESAEKTIAQSADWVLAEARQFYAQAETIKGAIEIAERQAALAEQPTWYSIRYPFPAYVLAFLYAKDGRLSEAYDALTRVRDRVTPEHYEVAKTYLQTL